MMTKQRVVARKAGKTTKPAAARERRIQSGYYEDGAGGKLFVPTEALWRLHEASKPKAVCEDAGIDWHLWYQWKEKLGDDHWLFLSGQAERRAGGYLYQGEQPNDGITTPEMRKFRAKSGRRPLASRASKRGASDAVTTGRISHWLNRYAHLPWFEGWLCRGEDGPEDVRIVTPAELMAAADAWHWQSYDRTDRRRGAKRAPKDDPEQEGAPAEPIYRRWFERMVNELPPETVFPIAWWSFGGDEPEGWFILPPKLRALRARLTPTGIRGAAMPAARVTEKRRAAAAAGILRKNGMGPGVADKPLDDWDADPIKRAALHCAVAAARAGRSLPPTGLAWQAAFGDEVDPKTRASRKKTADAMIRYARASTLTSAQEDVALHPASYQQLLERAAKAVGDEGKKMLRALIMGERDAPRSGVIAPGIYSPTPSMWGFRSEARKRSSANQISRLRQNVAEASSEKCFESFFLDWIKPRDLMLPAAISPAHSDPGLGTTGSARADAAKSPTTYKVHGGDLPADDALHCVAGGFWYGGEFHSLKGKAALILEVFVKRRTPISSRELAAEAWPGDEPEPKTIRVTLTQLRNEIRRLLKKEKDFNPILSVGHTQQTAWTLHPELQSPPAR